MSVYGRLMERALGLRKTADDQDDSYDYTRMLMEGMDRAPKPLRVTDKNLTYAMNGGPVLGGKPGETVLGRLGAPEVKPPSAPVKVNGEDFARENIPGHEAPAKRVGPTVQAARPLGYKTKEEKRAEKVEAVKKWLHDHSGALQTAGWGLGGAAGSWLLARLLGFKRGGRLLATLLGGATAAGLAAYNNGLLGKQSEQTQNV